MNLVLQVSADLIAWETATVGGSNPCSTWYALAHSSARRFACFDCSPSSLINSHSGRTQPLHHLVCPCRLLSQMLCMLQANDSSVHEGLGRPPVWRWLHLTYSCSESGQLLSLRY